MSDANGPIQIVLCNWLSLWYLVPWINYLAAVWWSNFWKWHWVCMFDIMENNFFIVFNYVSTYILGPHIMIIFYFYLPNFHVSNSALICTQYSGTFLLHRRSLDTFYMIWQKVPYRVHTGSKESYSGMLAQLTLCNRLDLLDISYDTKKNPRHPTFICILAWRPPRKKIIIKISLISRILKINLSYLIKGNVDMRSIPGCDFACTLINEQCVFHDLCVEWWPSEACCW